MDGPFVTLLIADLAGAIVATDAVRRIAGPRPAGPVRPAGRCALPGVLERVAVAEVRWRDDAEEPAGSSSGSRTPRAPSRTASPSPSRPSPPASARELVLDENTVKAHVARALGKG